MLNILTIVGARPQFIKAAVISDVIENKYKEKINESILHTGQHYDVNMSDIFFNELGIPAIKYNLEIGSASHGKQTALMISGIESVIMEERPDAVLVYGDTNSTLAGAIAASKLELPIIHIEAGLRSYTKKVPEEINRVVCDHLSTLLFSPTNTGVHNLAREGIISTNKSPYTVDNPGVFMVGDIMYDLSLLTRKSTLLPHEILNNLGLSTGRYVLVTIHRQDTTRSFDIIAGIFDTLNGIANDFDIDFLIPLHPRTRNIVYGSLDNSDISDRWSALTITDPVSYSEMIVLESNCNMIITDSGGVQKEAYFFNKPCVILQNETPWVELLDNGSSILASSDPIRIRSAFELLFQNSNVYDYPPIFGNGDSGEKIVAILENELM